MENFRLIGEILERELSERGRRKRGKEGKEGGKGCLSERGGDSDGRIIVTVKRRGKEEINKRRF